MKLNVVQNQNSQPWYAEGLQFTCQQSGHCCTGGPGYVWISEEEVGRLAQHLGITFEQAIKQYCRRIGDRLSLNEHRNVHGKYDCVFLRHERAQVQPGEEQVVHSRQVCSIYQVRPLQCRTWPFWEGLLEDKEAWDRAARGCPGMNQGKQFTREEIEALRDAQDWPQNPPTSAAKGQRRP
ncbi:MAG: YkgJ family cysteine cluster protein [Bacillota bacterium]